jgi:hypothetical protein
MISAEHDRTLSLELQACVRVPDMDAFLLFHRLRVTTELEWHSFHSRNRDID